MRVAAATQSTGFVPQHLTPVRSQETRLVLASDNPGRAKPQPAHLTARQLDVLALLCEGLPNKTICRRLNICSGTVKAHISSILRELGVNSRLQAVVAARKRGLLGSDHVSEERSLP